MSTCAKCHYIMRAKQQNIDCVLCKAKNVSLVVSESQTFSVEDTQNFSQFPAYHEGEIYFENFHTKKLFEELIGCKCPYCGLKEYFTRGADFLDHLTKEHGKFLW